MFNTSPKEFQQRLFFSDFYTSMMCSNLGRSAHFGNLYFSYRDW